MSKTTTLQPSLEDTEDHRNADRGFIAKIEPCVIKGPEGHTIWDNDQYNFLNSECPPTANPKLWRQGQLNIRQGLYEVVAGVYQVRGFDLSNITFVEGETGIIVIDPLISNECAKAALDLYRQHRGPRPVTGVIYSHSHIDHFGGAAGVLPSDFREKQIPVIGPEGFMEEALAENVFAGPAMRSRAAYMYGTLLPKNAAGQIGCGLGMTTSKGTTSLIPPTLTIREKAEEHRIDGVRVVFQPVPNTEAPAEINCYFPDHKALFIAECATHGMHNIITLRGAQVRDAKAWAKYLDETLVLFCQGAQTAEALLAGHNWPTWGGAQIRRLVSEQRDLYAYMHDQTLRLMNLGHTGGEIAERLALPPRLQRAWHAQGFYGSVSHNVKGIYQRYMTWFDGNPANLWKHAPAAEAARYVECLGGADAVVAKAQAYAAEKRDLRFAATLLDHVVAAEPSHKAAKLALADVFEQLGFGAENATWRNFYLTGALELRAGRKPLAPVTTGASTSTAAAKSGRLQSVNPDGTVEQWFDALSVQLDGEKACAEGSEDGFAVDFVVEDEGRCHRVRISNAALTHRNYPIDRERDEDVGLVVTMQRAELYQVLARGAVDVAFTKAEGDRELLATLLDLLQIPVVRNSEGNSKARL